MYNNIRLKFEADIAIDLLSCFECVTAGFATAAGGAITNLNVASRARIVFGVVNTVFYTAFDTGFGFWA